MGRPTGFKEFTRELPDKIPVEERVRHYNEFIENSVMKSSTTRQHAV